MVNVINVMYVMIYQIDYWESAVFIKLLGLSIRVELANQE